MFDSGGKQGEFDYYLMAMSWAPRFCCSNEKKCTSEDMNGIEDLSPHGLWPAYNKADASGRTYPAFCDATDKGGKKGPKDRETHEWSKHGTCTGLTKEQVYMFLFFFVFLVFFLTFFFLIYMTCI